MKLIDCLWWAVPAFMMLMVTLLGWHAGRPDVQLAISGLSMQIFIVVGCATEIIKKT